MSTVKFFSSGSVTCVSACYTALYSISSTYMLKVSEHCLLDNHFPSPGSRRPLSPQLASLRKPADKHQALLHTWTTTDRFTVLVTLTGLAWAITLHSPRPLSANKRGREPRANH
ncbi:hypothetical protein BaRGS_00014727 [Batillaria attramentaria]|uniref:Uncharacterized protein n=1 Tax=Batillaria attramentaria TaxID=370345 RepID=A0ABD0L3E8_9CAEN